jgi:phosphonate transport system permease protein
MFSKNQINLLKAFLFDLFFWSYCLIVCHKVIYEKIIIATRYPTFSWNTTAITIGIAIIITLPLFIFDNFSLGKKIKKISSENGNGQLFSKIFTIFLLLITFIAGLKISQVSLYEFLSPSGMIGAKRIFLGMIDMNFSIFEPALFATIETIYMAFIATVFAIPIAFLLSFFAARNLMSHNLLVRSIYTATRFVLNLTRSIEPLVWATILSVWVGIGPFAGMLALCLHSIASLAKLYSEQIENINDGPIEAMTATGAHQVQVIWFGVVPQIVLPFLSFTIYRWDINVRMATVIGLVGGGGIGTLLMQYQGLSKWNEVGLIVAMIAFVVMVMDLASAKIREAIK